MTPTVTADLLIARLEKATQGSVELDSAIAAAVLTEYREERLVGSPVAVATYRHPDGTRGTALRYTRSIDAALTLVPEGWNWSWSYGVAILSRKTGGEPVDGEHFIEQPALALAIAALKARSHS